MSVPNPNGSTVDQLNKWTVMVFFASDNELSPVVVPQVKAIKDAGFQEHTKVLVYFDANQNGVPTAIYDINAKRKADHKREGLARTVVGDGPDPFVHNLLEDQIDPDNLKAARGSASEAMKEGLKYPDKINAESALRNFIGFCREQYPADHYILLVLGHGLIVGNDKFLPDDFPDSGISLTQLGKMLQDFSREVENDESVFELLALHSCSMSALEVSYELKGTARYMIASEGLSFVGTWPYRQLFKKAFNSLQGFQAAKSKAPTNGSKGDIKELERLNASDLIEKLYYLSLLGTRDFAVAGYSLDVALTSLEKDKILATKEPLQNLVAQLREALKLKRGKELILLAHLESQSYWQEDYTDLVDFCLCLRRSCLADIEEAKGSGENTKLQDNLEKACYQLIELMSPSKDWEKRFGKLVVHSDNFGWRYQYSHGLSVFFPWSRPLGDLTKSIMENYKEYAFHQELKGSSWFDFLTDYFQATMRNTRHAEESEENPATSETRTGVEARSHVVSTTNFPALAGADPFGALDQGKVSPAIGDQGKVSPAIGFLCSCPSIKNYPAEQRSVKGKRQNVRTFAITRGACDETAKRVLNDTSTE